MSFGHALYYPHINLTNKNWVKHALLFWDKISRIVPHSVEPVDNEDVIKIRQESNFISDYRPEKWDTSNAFQDFSRAISQIIESDFFFNENFLRQPNRRRYLDEFKNRRRFFSELAQSNGTYIHVEKLDPRFKEYFLQIGIAIPGKHEWEDWIKIDNEIGLLYMTYFAKTISKNKALPIVTDVEQSFSAAIYFESSINSDWNHQFEYKLGNLLIESVVPKNINDVPLDTILEIRRKYDAERSAFFNEVSNLTNTIVGLDNANALQDALYHHSKIILQGTKLLEKLYNGHKIETANKFLSISLPTSLASMTDYVPHIVKPFLAGAGVIFGIVAAANSVKKDKLELQANPKSYLLNLKSELSGGDIFHRLNDSIKGIRKL